MASSSQSTPKRRRIGAGVSASQAYQASPAARALSGIRSWLSPWRGAATRSAAFGASDDSQDDDNEEDGPDDSMADHKQLYPPLPEPQAVEDDSRGQTNAASPAPFPFTFTSQPQRTPTSTSQQQQSPSQGVPSPLSHNYDILSRFFAEKAAAENGQAGLSSESKLTAEEIRGCIDLIQQSGAHPDEVHRAIVGQHDDSDSVPSRHEVPVRRRNTIRRSWLSPTPSQRSIYDPDSQSDLSYGGMSLSPDRAPSALYAQTPPPPSVRNLASRGAGLPHSSTEPASLFAQSLTGRRSAGAAPTNPFLTGSTSVSGSLAASKPRRRRPLYLGPGFSSQAGTSVPRRRTYGQSITNSQSSEPATTVGLGKRQRVDGLDEVEYGMDVDGDAPPTNRLDTTSPSRSLASLRASPPKQKQPLSVPVPSPARPRQSSAATAALSILQDSDLPKPSPPRKPVTRNTDKKSLSSTQSLSSLSEDAPAYSDTSFRADTILNPYQAAPGLKLGKSTNGSSSKSRSSEALERMKNERRKSTRSKKQPQDEEAGEEGDSSSSQGLLAQIERTRPSSMRATSRTSNGSSTSGLVEPPSTPRTTGTAFTTTPKTTGTTFTSTTPTSTPPAATDKTFEARRRLEAMKASAHAPGKPSRLSSIAFNANESPSSTASTAGDDDEDEAEVVNAKKPSFSFGQSSQSTSFSFGEKKGAESAASATSSSEPFSFGAKAAEESAASASKPFSFGSTAGAEKSSASAPFVFAQPAASETTPATSTPSFSFSKPSATSPPSTNGSSSTAPFLSFKPAPLPPLKNGKPAPATTTSDAPTAKPTDTKANTTSTPSNSSSATSTATVPTNTQAEAARTPISALVTFDLSSTVLGSVDEDVKKATGKAQAQAVAVEQLPQFDLGGVVREEAPAAKAAIATPAASFSFQPSPSPAPTASQATNSPAATTPDDDSSSSNPTSALLGSGEGEEDETTEFEVRAKFWKFVSGKWEDVGVGIAKVKSRNGSTSRRLLVRNSGNGAVSVNFSLVKDFSATQQGSSLSFTGFDAQGKGLPMRCKVKTEDSAAEFKGALEGSG